MSIENTDSQLVWKFSPIILAMIGLTTLFTGFIFQESIADLLMNWEREEYSHGYLIPIIALFLIWQQKDKLEITLFDGSWFGVVLILIGLLLYITGTMGAVIDIVSYGFIFVIFGVFLAFTGIKAFKLIAMALVLLFFMIPLPSFLYGGLSAELQLISSKIGVAIIRLFDISVYLEGNVIDLGVFKLQVVEACSGLRYLFPLVTLGFIAAYFFKVSLWKRVLIFLSTIPITVLMNSIRIGLIGVTVEYWGIEMAEGVLHDFEGWIVFMGCTVILILEMMLIVKLGKERRSLTEVFGVEMPMPTPESSEKMVRSIPKPFIAASILLVLMSAAIIGLPERTDVIPDRKRFSEFPMHIDGWEGRMDSIEQIYVDALRFDDYIMANYIKDNQHGSVNFYSGYYNIQRAGKVPHSPKMCIPGGGWRIQSLTQHKIEGVNISGVPLYVNRLLIQKDEYKQLVYYWFQQRERVVTSEYLVKWYLLADSIFMHRTDGALVRLTTIIDRNGTIAESEERLTEFAREIAPLMPEYIPN